MNKEIEMLGMLLSILDRAEQNGARVAARRLCRR